MATLEQAVIGAIVGVGFAIVGFFKGRVDSESGEYEAFNPRKFLRKVVVFAVAGGFVGYMGGDLSMANIEETAVSTGFIAAIGEAADNIIIGLRNRYRA